MSAPDGAIGAAKAPGADRIAVLRRDPASTALLTDFDGTLSPIVDDPAGARALAGATEVLVDLATRYAVVGVVSGRPLAFLEAHLPGSLYLSGLYGLERSHAGVREDHGGAGAWREVVADIVAAATAHPVPGARVEDKGLSITIHYREHPEIDAEVRSWAKRLATRSGLVARPAKCSVELHPPISVDKGTVVELLARHCTTVCYFGDDAGDLSAFAALDRLAAAGKEVVRIGVRSPEVPAEVLARADVVVDGPEGALELLRSL
jgi:trehalose 6-phosphate phosphatase